MKNKEITILELLQRIYDNNAPIEISYDGLIFCYDNELSDYTNAKNDNCLLEYIFSSCNWIKEKVEILLEENDEWEDIEEYDIGGPVGDIEVSLDYLKNVKCTNVEALLAETINKLIKNQKYLKENLESKDE